MPGRRPLAKTALLPKKAAAKKAVEKIRGRLEALLDTQRANRAKAGQKPGVPAEQVIADIMAMPEQG
ncbi:hypothetical protein GCM10011400_16850 [Paraburkholderia caffeinilytica]|jgi:hypothetical protein|uniref:Uncharacterized protein n=1 Tax=Paraburkholderia caffeinilytica TaxID=1761016 RepID=A0ABQ1LWF3_9BURK|nr:hypothetical protein GCM10011400_16850 [Paraburkholderia caffeinilytica]